MSRSPNPAIVEVRDNSEDIKMAIKQLQGKVKLKAVALNYYLMKKKELDLELEQEMKKLQIVYNGLAAPIYISSSEIIDGSRIPNEEELKDLDQFLDSDELVMKNQALSSDPIVGYWLNALRNSEIIAQEIREKDEQILSFLTKVEYLADEESENNFYLLFNFQTNDFFTNKFLQKYFILDGVENPVKSEGTIIEWKEGMNVTKKTVKKKQKNKKNGNMRMIAQEVDADSFFNFFGSLDLDEKEMIQKLDQDEVDRIAERMDIDYDLARMIIDEIIPYSLEYYLGVKMNDDGDVELKDDITLIEKGVGKDKDKKKLIFKTEKTQESDKNECKQQ